METKTKQHDTIEDCWRDIQKSYDSIHSGLTMLERAEMRMETLMRNNSDAPPELDSLGFGTPASKQDPDNGK
jgi:hypothetical protein